MNPLNESPRRLLRQLARMFDHPGSPWRDSFDVPAFEDVVVELAGGEAARDIDPERLELVTTFLATDPRGDILIRETFPALLQGVEFREVTIRLGELFRPGQDPGSTSLRDARLAAVTVFVDVLMGPMAERIEQVNHAAEERERYWHSRAPLIGEGFEPEDPRWIAPDLVVAAREAAGRVLRSVRARLSPRTFDALRQYLLNVGEVAGADSAGSAGRSAATVSEALQKLRRIAESECSDFTSEAQYLFATYLREEMTHA